MTPERLEELMQLVNSKWFLDRQKAAEAKDLPLELQEILARDEDWNVRYWLARNPSFTDHKLWELLRNDEDEDIRNIINKRIDQEKDKIKAEFKEKICLK